MATFNVGVAKNDIQEPELLPEDWYTVELYKDPTEEKNKAWKDAGETLGFEAALASNPKAGKNIVLRLKVISENPQHNGRQFTKWLSLPSSADEGAFMNNGQPKADWKAEQIYKWIEAFGGSTEGAEASLALGAKALVYVVVGKDQTGEKDANEISMNVAPRSLSGDGSGLGSGLL